MSVSPGMLEMHDFWMKCGSQARGNGVCAKDTTLDNVEDILRWLAVELP